MSLQIHVDNFTQLDHVTSLHHSATITAGYPVLIIPGLNNSDDNHWQTLWEKKFARAQRIEVKDWHQPDLHKLSAVIIKLLHAFFVLVILICHIFGELASVSIAAEFPEIIAAVLLVAPPVSHKFHITHRFPNKPLGAPVFLTPSRHDPLWKDSK